MSEGQILSKKQKKCTCSSDMKMIEKDNDAVVLKCVNPDCGIKKTIFFDKR